MNPLELERNPDADEEIGLAQRKAARAARGKEVKVERREELKKKAIWEKTRVSQTPKKAPDFKLRASTM